MLASLRLHARHRHPLGDPRTPAWQVSEVFAQASLGGPRPPCHGWPQLLLPASAWSQCHSIGAREPSGTRNVAADAVDRRRARRRKDDPVVAPVPGERPSAAPGRLVDLRSPNPDADPAWWLALGAPDGPNQEPSRKSARRSDRNRISSKVTLHPSPVGDWPSKPILSRDVSSSRTKTRIICQVAPSSEAW